MRFACQNVLACEARTTSVNIRLNARECYEPRLRASYITKSTSLVCEPHFQSSHTDLARQGWIQGSNARQILIIILSSMRGSHSYEASGLRGSHIPGMRGSHSYEASGLRGSHIPSMRGSHSYHASGLRGSQIPSMRGSHSSASILSTQAH